MNNYRKYFNGGLNADDDFELLKPGEWVNASNIRVFSTDNGAVGRVEEVGGHGLIFNTLPAGQNHCIGSVEDEQRNRIFFFNWNANGNHGIYCYDKLAATTYTVLLNSQVTGGLNFNKNKYIHSSIFIDNKIYWTDNLNEPRRINTEAGIKLNHGGYSTTVTAYISPLEQWNITIIRRSSYFPPLATKVYDAGYANNFIANTATQYALRYIYRDYEYSVIGAYSLLVPYNKAAETNNKIVVTVPLSERIDQDILEVELIVRYGNTGKSFVIKTWDRTAINAHNAGTALSFDFYNDISGIPVDSVAEGKPFESVPLLAEAIELARNRVFLGNVKQGYDTPVGSTLTTVINAIENAETSVIGTWGLITFNMNSASIGLPGSTYTESFYYIQTVSIPRFHLFATAAITLPLSVDLGLANISSDNMADLKDYYMAGGFVQSGGFYVPYKPYYDLTSYSFALVTPEQTATIINNTSSVLESLQVFKSNGTYQIAHWFLDKYRRKCGVVYSAANKLKMPDRTYAQSSFNTGINWTLPTGAQPTQIPDWAHYYVVGRTKCLNIKSFIEARAASINYCTKSDAGVITYLSGATAYTTTHYGVAIDISTIIAFGMGYVFNENDLVSLYFATGITGTQELSILEQDGKWLILQLKDFGSLPTASAPLFEIYTPLKQVVNELFYEVGNVYPITNPTLNTRSYSTLTSTLRGDVHIISRGGYITENMNPNDKFWKQWETDIGWPNIIDKIGQVTLPNEICFSDVYLPGTKVNGLSSFSALNTQPLDSENGAIKKLQLAKKVQTDGSVMLAICENETMSCYLGEQELFDTQGSAFVARASNVIGTVKSLRGSMGTSNPESVKEYNGLVWWYDKRNGCFVQYSDNGLFPISKYKMVRATNLFSKKYNSLSTAQIEALGSRPQVIGGYDPYHKEVFFTIPTTEATAPKGQLSDYSGQNYPYDIYDGQAKTLVFKNEADMWLGSMSMAAENFVRLGNELYAFKNGALYICNQTSSANFFGTQYTAKIMYSNNPGMIHRYFTIGLEGNKKPSFVHFRTENPFIQSSDLFDTNFTPKEGVQYAPILRDRFSPNTPGSFIQKQMAGDVLYGKTLLVMLEFEFVTDTSKLALRFSDIGYTLNKGHIMTK